MAPLLACLQYTAYVNDDDDDEVNESKNNSHASRSFSAHNNRFYD